MDERQVGEIVTAVDDLKAELINSVGSIEGVLDRILAKLGEIKSEVNDIERKIR